ncbi:MAG: hypothetical protein KAG98_04040, partial [Lentisphaeria bacterium]|nr:hypothetical protein [Lentisphaeria bacterium]
LLGTLTEVNLATGEFLFTPTPGTTGTSSFVYSLEGSEATVSITTVTKGLLLHYTFDESTGTVVGDSIAPGVNDATAPAEDAAWMPTGGKFNGAYELTGRNIIAPLAPFNNLTTAATISFWMKGTAANTNNKIINGLNSTGGDGREMQIALPYGVNSNCYFDWTGAGLAAYDRVDLSPKPVEVSDDQWHHWVATKDSATGNFIIYMDSNEIKRATAQTKNFGTFTEMTFGNGTQGLIDNLKLFDYALSADEVKKLDSLGAQDDYVSVANDATTPLIIDVKADNGNGPDHDPLNEAIILVQDKTNGTLVQDPDPTKSNIFTYTPKPNAVGTTTFTYNLGSTTNLATVYITTTGKGILFHYRLDEEPGENFVIDTTKQCSDSNTLPSSVILTGATGGSDLSLNRCAEITTGDQHIQIDNLDLKIVNGVTLVCWIKPKVGETFADYTGVMFSRVGMDGGIALQQLTAANVLDDEIGIRYSWNGRYQDNNTLNKIKIGRWNFIAMTVDPIAGTVKTYTGSESDADLVEASIQNDLYKGNVTMTSINLGRDNGAARTYKGYMRDARMFNYVLSGTTTRSALSLEAMFDLEKGKVVTPVLGLTVEQNGNVLSWSYLTGSLLKEFQIINTATGKVIATIIPIDG